MTEHRYPVNYCAFCGHQLGIKFAFCSRCGAQMPRLLKEHQEPPYPWSPAATFSVTLLSYGIFIICTIPFLFYFLVFFGLPFTESLIADPRFLIFTIVVELAFFLVPLGYVLGIKAPLSQLGLSTGGSTSLVKDVVLGLSTGVAMVPIMFGLVFYEFVSQGFIPPPTPPTPIEVFWLGLTCLSFWIVIAPAEELLSRGFVQNSLDAHYGNLAGLLISSIIFGLLHLNPLIGVGQTVLGVILGLLFRWRGRRLAAPIAAHAIYDCLVFILDVFLF